MHRTLRFAALTGALVLGLSGAAPQTARADGWTIEARWSYREPEQRSALQDEMRRLIEKRQRLLHQADHALARGNLFRAVKLIRQANRVEARLRERRQQLAHDEHRARYHRHSHGR